ncbi:hypothetical protein DPMN_166702 [Dreissena polymorpha]|uniref:Uncharacterized protein n=1 Tax=Dreissena polymorpha TaxID=45954 RepID=A0A9D4IXU7_DREPO|nr:hypothetical protein DPMN_166702 [Dreissena polymorpha]
MKALLCSETDENQMPASQIASVDVSGQLNMGSNTQLSCRKALEPVLERNTSAYVAMFMKSSLLNETWIGPCRL